MASRIMAAAVGLFSLILPSQASSIAAFYTAPLPGAQIIFQNATTGDITHSLCTSYGQPIFPRDPPRSFPLPYSAMNGTSLAATGWYDGTSVSATIFYQSINNDIVVAIYKCDDTTGSYASVSNFIVSSVKGTPTLNKNTGLAINLLGASNGEHLYFHDSNKAVHVFHFTNDAGWTYGSVVSPDHNIGSMALAAAFVGSNETVYTPKDSGNAEMSVFNTDNTWHISTFPESLSEDDYNSTSTSSDPNYSSTKPNYNLTAWDGKPGALGASIDKDNTKYMFYIGTDKKLHLATSALNSGEFQPFIMQPDIGPDLWPVADKSNADLALAYNPASYDVSLFYFSNGSIVAVNQTGRLGGWQTAYALPLANTTAAQNSTSSGSSGLTTGQQAGIGVGVGIAGLLIIGALVIFFLRQRRRKLEAQQQSATPGEMVMGPDGQLVPAGTLGMQTTGQPPYDYSQVQQQYDPRQYDYGSQETTQQWGPDKKGLSPGPPIGVEMPDNSPAHHRMSELPSDFHESHELPADVDRIQAASPVSTAAYTTPLGHQDYRAATSDLNSTAPDSPPQRAPSTGSWTAASPPPNYISQSTSPAPSTAYTQLHYQAAQPISPQMTGASAEHQYQQPQSYSPEGGYVQQAQPQHDQHQRELLGAITEQHEGGQTQYQGQHQDQAQYLDPSQHYQQQHYDGQQQQYVQQPQQHEQQYEQQPQHYEQASQQHYQ